MQHYILLIECNRIVHILYQFMLFIILPIFASCLFLTSLKTVFPYGLIALSSFSSFMCFRFTYSLFFQLLLKSVIPIMLFTTFFLFFLTQIPSSFLLILFFSFITCQTIRSQIPSSESSGDDDQRKANFAKAEIF